MSEELSRSQYRRIEAQGGNALELALIRIAALESSLRERDERVKALEEGFRIALQAVKFCAKWGGRSGRIPDPQPGSKHWHAKNALNVLKKLGLSPEGGKANIEGP